MNVKEKTVVKMLLSGSTVGHARTDVAVRDVCAAIDEPLERGGTNRGPTPTETLGASLLGCTNVISRRIARQIGMDIESIDMGLEMSFDRRGANLAEEVEVPFPAMHLTVKLVTDGTAEQVARLRTDLRRFCPVSKVLRAAGTALQESWEVRAP